MKELKPCGTRAAYTRHLRRGEPACDACLRANAVPKTPGQRAQTRAYARALRALARKHRAEFRELYGREKARVAEEEKRRAAA